MIVMEQGTILTLTLERVAVYASSGPSAGRPSQRQVRLEEPTSYNPEVWVVSMGRRRDGRMQFGNLSFRDGRPEVLTADDSAGRPLRYDVMGTV